jgi:DNA polymerase-2
MHRSPLHKASSLFLDMHLPDDVDAETATDRARKLCAEVNDALAKHLRDKYRVDSHLEFEFEQYYRRFLLPPSRGQTEKGRAKGYAGLAVTGGKEHVHIVGMEAVRRDWTALAHDFQRELFDLLFHDADAGRIEAFVSDTIQGLRAGKLDKLLVYRKALRKPLERYTKSTPPHVKAAQLLPGQPSGVIQYVMTRQGPQPVGYVTSPLDYEHYIQKQVLPIVRAIESFCDADMASTIDGEQRRFNW